MRDLNTKQLRAAVAGYTKRNTGLALLIFLADLLIYAAAIAGIIYLENVALRISCSIIAGSIISSIFVIAHDAAHDSFTNSKTLNRVIARISYLFSLHNYSLWLTAHNRMHHQSTNIQGLNSWSPLSKEEYDALTPGKQRLERFYRTPFGICFYYLIERWWKDKFYPYKRIAGKYNSVYWDFLLVVTYLVSFSGALVYAGQQLSHTSPMELIMLGLVVPCLIWNFMMGFTVYQHHTHESIAWTKTREERDQLGGQEDFTMYVRYPRWYNLISHDIMEHTAHHVDPRIPLYHLAKAQKVLCELLGEEMHTIRFSLAGFLQTLVKCKLYDYENHCWLDFEGTPTTESIISRETEFQDYMQAA